MTDIEMDKYIINKNTYLSFIKHIQNGGGIKSSVKYDCVPTNKYNNICKESKNGKYNSRNSCINDCDPKYIDHQLTKANIKAETLKFYLFIRYIIKNEHMKVYIKGGNVIGLYILKMIHDKYKHDRHKFKSIFNEFLKLGLMKDWDFVAYTEKNDDDTYKSITSSTRKRLDNIAKKYKLVPRAKTFILYRTEDPILLDNDAFIEIALLDTDNYSTLELPMTTMKAKIDTYNIKYIYMLAKSFLSFTLNKEEFDFDIMKKIIGRLKFKIHPHKDGLYLPKTIDTGGFSDDFVEFIKTITKNNNVLTQFLITQMKDPYRLLYRFPEKNIPKTNKIKHFIKTKLNVSMPSWLIDVDFLVDLINTFAKKLGEKLLDIYTNDDIISVNHFMRGVKFDRTRIEYNTITPENIAILNLIFDKLLNKIKSDKIAIVSGDKNDITTFINFLQTVQ